MLKLKNLTKYYGTKKAISNVSFDINDGEIFGLVGFVGSGKTTVVRTILDYLTSDRGTIENGFKKEDIRIELKEGTLKISASRNIEKNLEGKIIRQERFSGTYSRSFYVGEAIIPQDIKASFDNGELIITLPTEKQKEKQGRQLINIE